MLTNILLALILVVLTIGMMIIEGKLLAILKEIEFFREDLNDWKNKKESKKDHSQDKKKEQAP